jgi:hypothetical protein
MIPHLHPDTQLSFVDLIATPDGLLGGVVRLLGDILLLLLLPCRGATRGVTLILPDIHKRGFASG